MPGRLARDAKASGNFLPPLHRGQEVSHGIADGYAHYERLDKRTHDLVNLHDRHIMRQEQKHATQDDAYENVHEQARHALKSDRAFIRHANNLSNGSKGHLPRRLGAREVRIEGLTRWDL